MSPGKSPAHELALLKRFWLDASKEFPYSSAYFGQRVAEMTKRQTEEDQITEQCCVSLRLTQSCLERVDHGFFAICQVAHEWAPSLTEKQSQSRQRLE